MLRSRLNRRELLSASALAGSTVIFASVSAGAKTISGELPWSPGEANYVPPVSAGPYKFFSSEEAAWVDAAVSRLIPKDELGPGAKELGVAVFLDRQLAGAYGRAERWYMGGPWAKGTKTQGYQSRMTPAQVYRAGIAAVDEHCRGKFQNKTFVELSSEDQDKVLGGLEEGKISLEKVDAKAFFKQLLLNTQEGFFADPMYGGNKDMAAWKMIGFPGARYDYRDFVGKHGQPFPLPPVSIQGRPAWNPKS